MTFEDAEARINAAVEADNAPSAPAPVDQPAEPSTPQGSEPAATPAPGLARDEHGRFVAAPEAPVAEPVAEDSFTKLDPTQLSDELKPFYNSMLADYTRKTQEAAPWRKIGEELGVEDPTALREAVELQRTLADPSNWPVLHEQLTDALQEMGLSPAQAAAEATQQLTGAAQQPQTATDLSALEADPELAPLAQHIRSLEAKLENVSGSLEERAAVEHAEQVQMALAGELQRQENMILQANPQYQDEDINMVYELSSFHDGQLTQAQQRLEDYVNSRIVRYVQGKQSVIDTPGVSALPNAGTTAEQRAEMTWDERGEAAEEFLRRAGLEDMDFG